VAFPEYHGFFSTIHTKTSYTLLEEYSTATEISKVRVDKLQNVLDTYQSRYSAGDLKTMAKRSIGTHTLAVSFEIKSLIKYYKT